MAVEEERVIRFYDPELNFLKEVDDYTAFIYRSKWNSYGTFELYMDRRLPCVQKVISSYGIMIPERTEL